MRQFIQMFIFDIKMSFKNFMAAYIIIVPVIILLVLRLFLPSVENTTATIAVVNEGPNAVPEKIQTLLSEFASIKQYPDIESVKEKLRAADSAEGLYFDPEKNSYISILEKSSEANKLFSIASVYIRQNYLSENYPDKEPVTIFSSEMPEELASDSKTSPVASMGGSIFLIFMIIITGFLIGLSVVDDKENGTIKAIRTSPVNSADYYVGKSFFPLLVMIFYTVISLAVLKMLYVNIAQVFLIVAAAFPVTLFLGLLIGGIGNNEVEAMGIGKITSVFLILAVLGSAMLPGNWVWVVRWIPVYWIYDMLLSVFNETADWGTLLWKSAVAVSITALFFLLLRKKIIKGLQ